MFDLLDYNSKKLETKQYKLYTNLKILENASSNPDKSPDDHSELLNVAPINGNCWVFDKYEGTRIDPLWHIVRMAGIENGDPLAEGDIIRFGRMEYHVDEIHIEDPLNKEPPLDSEINPPENEREDRNQDRLDTNPGNTEETAPSRKTSTMEDAKQIENGKIHCRICLSEETTKVNPLINSLCNCIGTTKGVHAECLERWLNSKIKITKRPNVTSYYWKPFECDICRAKYPDIIRFPNGRVLQALNIHKPKKSYIILQNETLINYHCKF